MTFMALTHCRLERPSPLGLGHTHTCVTHPSARPLVGNLRHLVRHTGPNLGGQGRPQRAARRHEGDGHDEPSCVRSSASISVDRPAGREASTLSPGWGLWFFCSAHDPFEQAARSKHARERRGPGGSISVFAKSRRGRTYRRVAHRADFESLPFCQHVLSSSVMTDRSNARVERGAILEVRADGGISIHLAPRAWLEQVGEGTAGARSCAVYATDAVDQLNSEGRVAVPFFHFEVLSGERP